MVETEEQKQCPYCHGGRDLINPDYADIIPFVYVVESEALIQVETEEGFWNKKIIFCPMCGRRLEW